MLALVRIAVLVAAALASLPAVAASRQARRAPFCTPAYIEGAGTVLICGTSNRARRR